MSKITIGIIGLGLIGGSLGLTLRENPNYKIIGFDRNPNHIKEALKLQLVDEVVDLETVCKSDILFLAIPVVGIIELLKQLENLISPKTTIIDMGSTKFEIVQAIPKSIRNNFIPAHPMAGTEKNGPIAALKDLYQNKIVILCDIEKSGQTHIQKAKDIFQFLKMKIIYMNSEEHDKHIAWISHLPHVLSYSLANSVMAQEEREAILNLSAGGFRDMSRLAKSSPKMWRDIFQQNRENLLESISYFQDELEKLKKLIIEKDWNELENQMRLANKLHEIL